MPELARVRVSVLWSPAAREVTVLELELPAGARVRDALLAAEKQAAAALASTGGAGAPPPVSLWGRKTTPETMLRDGDRVEICRPLQVDPKVARRERFQQQGARAAGLFARKRAGAKAGY